MSKKPGRDEFLNVAKITGVGVLIIGAIGFVISIGAKLLGKI